MSRAEPFNRDARLWKRKKGSSGRIVIVEDAKSLSKPEFLMLLAAAKAHRERAFASVMRPKAKAATPKTWRPRFELGVDTVICFHSRSHRCPTVRESRSSATFHLSNRGSQRVPPSFLQQDRSRVLRGYCGNGTRWPPSRYQSGWRRFRRIRIADMRSQELTRMPSTTHFRGAYSFSGRYCRRESGGTRLFAR